MKALFVKDFRNAKLALAPAFLLGLPLLLIIAFTQDPVSNERISWRSAFWLVYFVGTTSLFYRSFGFENRFQTFHIYRAFTIAPLKIFASQALVHCLTSILMGLFYLGVTLVLWSPQDFDSMRILSMVAMTSVILSPIGTLLGLMFQIEREFLFPLIFLPIATPVVLGAYSFGLQDGQNWLWILATFLVGSIFICSLIFHFFFDDLTT